MDQPPLFKWRHFAGEIIVCGVRWYLRYALSYRDIEELMQERGVTVDHTTVFRWVQHYAPELDKRSRPHLTKRATPITSMRHTSRSRSSGIISIGPSIPRVRLSTFCSVPGMMPQPPNASSGRLSEPSIRPPPA